MQSTFVSQCSFCGREYNRREDKTPEGCRDPVIVSHGICSLCNNVILSIHEAKDLAAACVDESISKQDSLIGILHVERIWLKKCEKRRTERKGE